MGHNLAVTLWGEHVSQLRHAGTALAAVHLKLWHRPGFTLGREKKKNDTMGSKCELNEVGRF